MKGVMGVNLAYKCIPSSSNYGNIGAGRVYHKGTIQKVTSGDGI